MRLLVALLSTTLILSACESRHDESSETPQPATSVSEVVAREASGEQLYLACQGCHSIAAGEPHRVGPNLYGMLAAWIVETEMVVPGTWMAYSNILEADEIQSLINYIRQASSAGQDQNSP
jgi:cytochrome c2